MIILATSAVARDMFHIMGVAGIFSSSGEREFRRFFVLNVFTALGSRHPAVPGVLFVA